MDLIIILLWALQIKIYPGDYDDFIVQFICLHLES